MAIYDCKTIIPSLKGRPLYICKAINRNKIDDTVSPSFMFGRNYCSICGMKVDKERDFQRFGKHFCSEQHAEQYVQEMQNSRQATLTRQSDPNDSRGCGG